MPSDQTNTEYEYTSRAGEPDFHTVLSEQDVLTSAEITEAWKTSGKTRGKTRGKSSEEMNDPASRIITKAEGLELFQRIAKLARGGGDTQVTVRSSSVGNLQWARNRPTTSGITMTRSVRISRIIDGGWSSTVTTLFDDASLAKVVSEVESRLIRLRKIFTGPHTYDAPALWNDSNFNVTAADRSNAAREGVAIVASNKLVAAGYIETDVATWGVYNTLGVSAYSAANSSLFQISVRHPKGHGSGWRGIVDDWTNIDTKQISQKAIEASIASANPRAIEPGRYMAVMHPDVVAAMAFQIADRMDRKEAEDNPDSVFGMEPGVSRIGTKVIDERLSVISDPLDPLTSFIPFDDDGYPVKRTVWIEKGVLKELSYGAWYARENFGTAKPLLFPYAFRLVNNGPVSTIDEMIASTKRGIYMERMGESRTLDPASLQGRSITRDGLWLIENGKLKYPLKNMHILESPMAIFNRVVQIGEPQPTWGRRYRNPHDNVPAMALHTGRAPLAAPAMKVEDFNFAMLADAI